MIAILLTLLAALALEIVPLPGAVEFARPEWMALVLIYWAMALPHRVGVVIAWLAGLLTDAATGSLLGLHALSLMLVVGIILLLHRRLRVLPLAQQAMLLVIFLSLDRLLSFWIRGAAGQPPELGVYLLPVATSIVVWPLIFLGLRHVRRRFDIR